VDGFDPNDEDLKAALMAACEASDEEGSMPIKKQEEPQESQSQF